MPASRKLDLEEQRKGVLFGCRLQLQTQTARWTRCLPSSALLVNFSPSQPLIFLLEWLGDYHTAICSRTGSSRGNLGESSAADWSAHSIVQTASECRLAQCQAGGLPPGSQTQALQRQHSSPSGHDYARHSGYGSGHLQRPSYTSPAGRITYPQDPWMQYRDSTSRPSSSRASSTVPSHALSTYGRSYGYAPSSTYAPSAHHSHSGSSRYSGHGYSRSGSSAGYTPQSFYDSDDEDYTHVTAPSSVAESEPHFASGYAEATFVIEPSDSGSEASYSGGHSSYGDSESGRGDSSSGYSGSEGDSVYSEGADDEYEDYDDGGSYSDDGGYYSDD
ncbi:hypothetical protein DFH09DRAFT_1083011 [Mycena vulgaris]|nr:hypothetical protein DFH09DRAFT_1083011 [Mycena vulgaris]